MPSSTLPALVVLLVAIVSSTDAVKCHHCNDCGNSWFLPSASECTKITFPDDVNSFFDSMNLGGLASGFENVLNKITGAVVRSCYKVVKKTGDSETVYRGCSAYIPHSDPVCTSLGNSEACTYICEGDGCNSAPSTYISGTILITCLLIACTFVLA